MHKSRQTAFLYILMLLISLVSVGPFLWLLSTALKGPEENLFVYPPQFIPRNITLGNFVQVFAGIPFPRYLINSFLTAAVSVALNLVIAAMASYPLARMTFPGKTPIFLAILSTMMIPFQVIMIPIFIFVTRLGLKNTYAGLVLPTAVTAFGIFLIRQAFLIIPRSLEEAALIDGSRSWTVFSASLFPWPNRRWPYWPYSPFSVPGEIFSGPCSFWIRKRNSPCRWVSRIFREHSLTIGD